MCSVSVHNDEEVALRVQLPPPPFAVDSRFGLSIPASLRANISFVQINKQHILAQRLLSKRQQNTLAVSKENHPPTLVNASRQIENSVQFFDRQIVRVSLVSFLSILPKIISITAISKKVEEHHRHAQSACTAHTSNLLYKLVLLPKRLPKKEKRNHAIVFPLDGRQADGPTTRRRRRTLPEEFRLQVGNVRLFRSAGGQEEQPEQRRREGIGTGRALGITKQKQGWGPAGSILQARISLREQVLRGGGRVGGIGE